MRTIEHNIKKFNILNNLTWIVYNQNNAKNRNKQFKELHRNWLERNSQWNWIKYATKSHEIISLYKKKNCTLFMRSNQKNYICNVISIIQSWLLIWVWLSLYEKKSFYFCWKADAIRLARRFVCVSLIPIYIMFFSHFYVLKFIMIQKANQQQI